MDISVTSICASFKFCHLINLSSWHLQHNGKGPAVILLLHLTDILVVHAAGKGLGEDPCISKLSCEYCELLTPEHVIQLATPTYKLRKEKAKSKESLVDPA